ncbi:MAG: heparinase II/III family protein, partial [Pseudomonadota bacterium]
DAEIDLGGSTVSLELKSGEVWVFQHSGRARLSLEQSVFLERGRLAPRVTQQIVLSSAAMDYATRVLDVGQDARHPFQYPRSCL